MYNGSDMALQFFNIIFVLFQSTVGKIITARAGAEEMLQEFLAKEEEEPMEVNEPAEMAQPPAKFKPCITEWQWECCQFSRRLIIPH